MDLNSLGAKGMKIDQGKLVGLQYFCVLIYNLSHPCSHSNLFPRMALLELWEGSQEEMHH